MEARAVHRLADRAVQPDDGEREPVLAQQLTGAAHAPRGRDEHRHARVAERGHRRPDAGAHDQVDGPQRAVEIGDDDRRAHSSSSPSR